MPGTAIFPGSFDPFTKGHEDVVRRSLKLFDKVIVAIGYNTEKHSRHFEVNRMVAYIEAVFPNDAVEVTVYNELTAEFAAQSGAQFIIRGLRNTHDFNYENSIAQINKHLNPDLETVFFITSPAVAHISSGNIREVHRYGGDVSAFLPYKLQ